jgi:hypothetical protein
MLSKTHSAVHYVGGHNGQQNVIIDSCMFSALVVLFFKPFSSFVTQKRVSGILEKTILGIF